MMQMGSVNAGKGGYRLTLPELSSAEAGRIGSVEPSAHMPRPCADGAVSVCQGCPLLSALGHASSRYSDKLKCGEVEILLIQWRRKVMTAVQCL
ncbi:hypothetical protein AAFF_G00153390 [Aldrovandia affinis]|uniref:Uncharacterized protein n=1 Tax=Aldrovandia affinis TaxID=143900 RepID=A0AAD7WW26_9TELE|nr:hypothetical protein AAFF_G00153390 [Aldrovandia affinis]